MADPAGTENEGAIGALRAGGGVFFEMCRT